jgi:hypothetical protein
MVPLDSSDYILEIRRMDGSFGLSRCFTIILGGLGLYKPSAPGLVSDAPIL